METIFCLIRDSPKSASSLTNVTPDSVNPSEETKPESKNPVKIVANEDCTSVFVEDGSNGVHIGGFDLFACFHITTN